MKYGRLLGGIVLVAVTLWILVGEQIAGASANAVVNAPVVTLRASISGELSLPDRPYGAQINESEVVARINDMLVDNVRLNDLIMERGFAQAAVQKVSARLERERQIRDALRDRTKRYREYRLEELNTQLEHARARLAIIDQRSEANRNEESQTDLIGEDKERVRSEDKLGSVARETARERVSLLEIALRAARQHVFLGDGYNDSPNSEQRAVELDSVINGLEADLAEAEARRATIDERIRRAEVRINKLTGGEIRSPVRGLLWDVLEADGITVQRGDPLLKLVDCSATMVTLSVSESVYNGLERGQAAQFRLNGSDRAFKATITRLAGSGAASIYGDLAVAPSEQQLERYDVAILVPALTADPELGCAIGRTGRVFFETRPLDWLRDLFR